MNKIKENYVIRLCDDKLFKEVFSKVPTALVRMVCDCLELDYDEIKDIAIKTYRTRKQAESGCSSWDRDFEVVECKEIYDI